MTYFSDEIRTGKAGTPLDPSGRRLPAALLVPTGTGSTQPNYQYAEGGLQTQPQFYWDNNGTPIVAATATGVVNAATVSSGGSVTLNGSLVTAGVAVFDVGRCVAVKSSNSGDTTQTITIVGVDMYNSTLTSTVTLNGTTVVNTKKAFFKVTSVTASASMSGTLSVGTSDTIGLPWAIYGRRQVLTSYGTPPNGDVQVTTGTIVAADTTSPATALTGDVRGTFALPSASNGANVLAFDISMNQSQANNVTLAIGVAQV